MFSCGTARRRSALLYPAIPQLPAPASRSFPPRPRPPESGAEDQLKGPGAQAGAARAGGTAGGDLRVGGIMGVGWGCVERGGRPPGAPLTRQGPWDTPHPHPSGRGTLAGDAADLGLVSP